MEGHVFTQLDLQLASVVCEFIGIRQFRLGLIVIIHLKQAFINQIQHADHIALVQLQRAQFKVVLGDDGAGQRRGNGKTCRGNESQHHAEQAGCQTGKAGNAHGRSPYDSVSVC